ncbi:MAG: hypothetical protein AAFX54_15040 [Pseudomonadota bacterium]
MRALVGLSIIQTLLLAVLGLKLFAVEAQVDAATRTGLDVLSQTAQLKQAGIAARSLPTQNAPSLTGADIRQIIREEIAATDSDAHMTRTAEARPRETASYGDKADVQRELDAYLARGGIGQMEMAKLQMSIAQLSPAERSEMLSKLTTALNQGDIDGQF